MKSIIKKTVLALVVAPLAFGSAFVMANGGGTHQQDGQKCHGQHAHYDGKGDRGHKGGKDRKGGNDRGIWKQIDLTDAQKTEMKELHQANREAMKADRDTHKEEAKIAHQKMDELVLSSSFDEAAVRSLAESMLQQRVDGSVARAKAENAKFNILTAEQQTKFKELKAEQAQKRLEKRTQRQEKRAAKQAEVAESK